MKDKSYEIASAASAAALQAAGGDAHLAMLGLARALGAGCGAHHGGLPGPVLGVLLEQAAKTASAVQEAEGWLRNHGEVLVSGAADGLGLVASTSDGLSGYGKNGDEAIRALARVVALGDEKGCNL